MIVIKSKIEIKLSILSIVFFFFVFVSLDLFFLVGFFKLIEVLSFGNCIIYNFYYWVIFG